MNVVLSLRCGIIGIKKVILKIINLQFMASQSADHFVQKGLFLGMAFSVPGKERDTGVLRKARLGVRTCFLLGGPER